MENRDAPPQSGGHDVTLSEQSVTGEILDALSGTKPWVLLIGVCALVAAVFNIYGAISTFFAGAFKSAAGLFGVSMGSAFSLINFFMALIYLMLGWFLIKYSSSINRLVESGAMNDLETALHQQRKFWRLAGVITLVLLVTMAFTIAGMVFMAFKMH